MKSDSQTEERGTGSVQRIVRCHSKDSASSLSAPTTKASPLTILDTDSGILGALIVAKDFFFLWNPPNVWRSLRRTMRRIRRDLKCWKHHRHLHTWITPEQSCELRRSSFWGIPPAAGWLEYPRGFEAALADVEPEYAYRIGLTPNDKSSATGHEGEE